jgi:hypothetical protein
VSIIPGITADINALARRYILIGRQHCSDAPVPDRKVPWSVQALCRIDQVAAHQHRVGRRGSGRGGDLGSIGHCFLRKISRADAARIGAVTGCQKRHDASWVQATAASLRQTHPFESRVNNKRQEALSDFWLSGSHADRSA